MTCTGQKDLFTVIAIFFQALDSRLVRSSHASSMTWAPRRLAVLGAAIAVESRLKRRGSMFYALVGERMGGSMNLKH